MKRQGVSYSDLSAQLARIHIRETEANLRNKISRGTFTTIFLLQCMAALDVTHLHLGEHRILRE